MKVHNAIPLLLSCLRRWNNVPSEAQFRSEYAHPLRSVVGNFFEDFHEVLLELDWKAYRDQALKLDPDFEEKRFQQNLKLVEDLFGFRLEGEVFLLGTFQNMDGFARFDQGTHKVFLGLDENHLNGKYIDVLTTHELTHVARESRPEVWEGFGLNPKMSRKDFLEYQPVIEHLFGEGFSCAVSEILVPGEEVWNYTYQSKESIELVYKNSSMLSRRIHREIQDPNGDYGTLYGIEPIFSHYVWGSAWIKKILQEHAGGDPRSLVSHCSKTFLEDALRFHLTSIDSTPTAKCQPL